MANAILTSPFAGEVAQNTPPFDFSAMPQQALVAIANGSLFTLSYNRSFNGLAPSLASAIVAASPVQFGTKGQNSLLANGVSVDLNVNGGITLLYTVPAGKTAIIRRVIIRNASVSLTMASVSFGWNSAAFNNVIADATHTVLTGASLYVELLPAAGATVGAAAGTFKVKVNTPQGAAATALIDVFGYLV
jgi:hypothetical protein